MIIRAVARTAVVTCGLCLGLATAAPLIPASGNLPLIGWLVAGCSGGVYGVVAVAQARRTGRDRAVVAEPLGRMPDAAVPSARHRTGRTAKPHLGVSDSAVSGTGWSERSASQAAVKAAWSRRTLSPSSGELSSSDRGIPDIGAPEIGAV
jgi:hypothetical protein